MNKNRFYFAIGILFAAFSLLSFVLPFQHNAVFWAAYVSGVLAIAIQIYSIPASVMKGYSARSRFYGLPVLKVTITYLVLQLIVCFLFMIAAGLGMIWMVRIEVTISIILLIATVIGFFSTNAIREEIERQDVELSKNVSRMRALQSQMVSLVNQCPDASAKAELTKLSDAFRFSDPVSSEATIDNEADLESFVNDIQTAMLEADYSGIISLCDKAQPVLARRNQICRQNKQSGGL